ncbi:MAG: porin family protein [Alphaproteobacteria bacterium]|nr:MAG: porin family protein [Alphaproteobacteria bacterium]
MRIVYAAAVLAAASAAPAFAHAAPAPFVGGHIEAIAGYDSLSVDGDSDGGIAYGIAGGYDFALGTNMRAGLELEAAESTAEECQANVIVAGDRACAEARRDFYVGARLGGVVSNGVLLYAKLGYTNARVGAVYDNGTTVVSDGANADGIRAGAGADIALGRNMFLRAEYRYSNYESDFSRHQGVVGLGFRF